MNISKLVTQRFLRKTAIIFCSGSALLFIIFTVTNHQPNPILLHAGLFSSDADPGMVTDVFNNLKDDTDLPHGSFEKKLIPVAIRLILGLSSVFLTAIAIWAGILYVAQFGTPERVARAHKLLYWAIVGVVVSALSYAIIYGVLNLNFD